MHFSQWITGALICAAFTSTFAEDHFPAGYKLLYEQTFDKPDSLQQFEFTDGNAWKFVKDEKGGSMELASQSKYNPAFRSPFNIALIKGKVFGDFVLEADLLQTGEEYGHRDMCLFLGFQDPSHFYYVHMATKADPHAHNIFLVNDAPRTNIAQITTGGINWGNQIWHHVRLERKLADGSIKVFFDDMSLPIMSAQDKTFGAGYVGFGSFDDTGKVDNIKIWAPELGPEKPPIRFKTSTAKP